MGCVTGFKWVRQAASKFEIPDCSPAGLGNDEYIPTGSTGGLPLTITRPGNTVIAVDGTAMSVDNTSRMSYLTPPIRDNNGGPTVAGAFANVVSVNTGDLIQTISFMITTDTTGYGSQVLDSIELSSSVPSIGTAIGSVPQALVNSTNFSGTPPSYEVILTKTGPFAYVVVLDSTEVLYSSNTFTDAIHFVNIRRDSGFIQSIVVTPLVSVPLTMTGEDIYIALRFEKTTTTGAGAVLQTFGHADPA